MTTNLDDLLRSVDPLTEELDQEIARHRDAIWSEVLAREVPARPRHHRQRTIVASSVVAVAAVVALVVGLVPATAPPSAAAATLEHAALADAPAATLPALGPGQYYYQEARVTMACEFAAAEGTGSGPWISYVSKGTMQSWTSPSGGGRIVITPTPVDEGGSHFATPADHARWITEGRPFVPCALDDPSNQLAGNPANASHQSSYGGYASSVTGYAGFGFILGIAQVATPVTATGAPESLVVGAGQTKALRPGTNITNLPDDPGQIASMLANGEIGTDGSVSVTPQVCPVSLIANAAPGCDTGQQLQLIQQLLQLPDASAKFGSALYDVLAQMPGATVAANTIDGFGNTGTTVSAPVGGTSGATSEFQVVLDPKTGALLSSTALTRMTIDGTVSPTFSPEAAISYGAISVVPGLGVLPNTTH